MQQAIAVFLLTQLEATCSDSHNCPHNAYIADSSPALDGPSSALSSSTALEQALPSFNVRLMMVTNDSKVTEASWHSSSTAFFPEASNLKLYDHKLFTIVINSLDTSVIAKYS